MELFLNQGPEQQTITSYGDRHVIIGGERFSQSILILPDAPPVPWQVPDVDHWEKTHFLPALATSPDILLIGTGIRQRFLPPRLIAMLASGKTGVEYMNNSAACRTFNLLISEGRRAALALFMENHS